MSRRERVDANILCAELTSHATCHLEDRWFAGPRHDPEVVVILVPNGTDWWRETPTLFVMLPLLPNRSICCPAAWAVYKTSFVLTSMTFEPVQSVRFQRETKRTNPPPWTVLLGMSNNRCEILISQPKHPFSFLDPRSLVLYARLLVDHEHQH